MVPTLHMHRWFWENGGVDVFDSYRLAMNMNFVCFLLA